MQSFSGAILNLILIMLMANVYTAVAEWLTKWGEFFNFCCYFFFDHLVCVSSETVLISLRQLDVKAWFQGSG